MDRIYDAQTHTEGHKQLHKQTVLRGSLDVTFFFTQTTAVTRHYGR